MESIYFTDERYPDNVIHIDQLKQEYGQHIVDGAIDPAEKTFEQYVNCCLSCNGGTLTGYKSKPQKFKVTIRQTLCRTMDFVAETPDDAMKQAEELYEAGEFDPDFIENGCDMTFRCPGCNREIESINGLLKAADGRYLCKACWYKSTLD